MLKLVAFIALPVFVGGCSDSCKNSIVSTAHAQSGHLQAVLFQRDCGATTGFSTQISLTSTGKTPSGSGNVFVADDDHGAARAASWGGPLVELRWLSPQSLLIRYDAKARVFTRNDSVSGVRISYEKMAR